MEHDTPPRAHLDTAVLHRLTTELGISQRVLARRIGVDRSSIIRWAHGRAQPSPCLLIDMAAALGVAPGELFRPGPQGPDLAYYRVLAGWSANALSAALGVNNSVVRAVESGRRPPSPPLADRLRALLGIDDITLTAALHRSRQQHPLSVLVRQNSSTASR